MKDKASFTTRTVLTKSITAHKIRSLNITSQLTSNHCSSYRSQKADADSNDRDHSALPVPLQHHKHQHACSTVDEQRGEESPEEDPVPHL